MTPAFDEITPVPEDESLELIHERSYIVRAYRKGTDTLVLRGALRDQKPPGLYVPQDPDPLTVHHMIVDLYIRVPSLEIFDAKVVMEMHPHATCPTITEHYQKLIGMSIARGFINKVRELFGGPRGCTHTTALLQAMAPVAIQSMWSFRMSSDTNGVDRRKAMATPEAREQAMAMNLNTCHMWDENGEMVQGIRAGVPMETPVWIVKRFAQLGLDPEAWRGG